MEKESKLRNEQIAFSRGYSVTPKGMVVNYLGKPVKVTVNDQGYKIFGTGSIVNKTFKNISVHRLQAYMKYGDKMYLYKVVRHLDGVKSNNSIENICVGSYVDNYYDIKKLDRQDIIDKISESKRSLSDVVISDIFKLKSKGVMQTEIAKKHGLSNSHVSNILNNKTGYKLKNNKAEVHNQ